VHYVAVYVVVMGIPIGLNWRETGRRLWAAVGPRDDGGGRADALALGFLLYTLALHWLMALKPEISGDGMAMHLVIPAQVAWRHYWPFDVSKFVWAMMPMACNWAYALAYLPGGEYAARLLNFGFLAAVGGGIAGALRGRVPGWVAYLSAALFVSTPIVQFETGCLLVENFWALLVLGALLAVNRMEEDAHPGWLVVAAAIAGIGVATKFGCLPYSLAVMGWALWRHLRAGRSRKWAVAAVVVFVAMGAWPYVNSWRVTGSPLFPYRNAFFKSPLYDLENFADVRYRARINWRTLYDVTFESHRFIESQDGALGFQWFLLLPLAALGLWGGRQKLTRAAMVVAIAGGVVTFSGQSYLRYVYPSLVLLTLVIGLGWQRLRELDGRLGVVFTALALAVAAVNVYFIPSSNWHHKDFALNPLNGQERERYRSEAGPSRALVEVINASGEEDPQVAFLDDNAVGELHGTAWANSWHNRLFLRALRRPMFHPIRMLEFFRRLGITWFITYSDPKNNPLTTGKTAFNPYPFLALYTDRVAESGACSLWRLKPAVKSLPPEVVFSMYQDSLPPAAAGFHDDADSLLAFYGPWVADHNFAEPHNHTISFCDQPQCRFEFRFSGRRLTWYYTAAPNRGKAHITIGATEADVDQYAPRVEWKRKAAFDVGPGEHRVVVRVLGSKQAASAGTFVDVDGLEVE
jgi:hypothetical protein